jgi:hypothetical protein
VLAHEPLVFASAASSAGPSSAVPTLPGRIETMQRCIAVIDHAAARPVVAGG